jgi:hypothetical protein
MWSKNPVGMANFFDVTVIGMAGSLVNRFESFSILLAASLVGSFAHATGFDLDCSSEDKAVIMYPLAIDACPKKQLGGNTTFWLDKLRSRTHTIWLGRTMSKDFAPAMWY